MSIVTDPNEAALIADGTLPDASQTVPLVLSDTTVCNASGTNDPATYVDPTTIPVADRPEWLSGATSQPGPTPTTPCEIAPAGAALNEDGTHAAAPFAAGKAPNTHTKPPTRSHQAPPSITHTH